MPLSRAQKYAVTALGFFGLLVLAFSQRRRIGGIVSQLTDGVSQRGGRYFGEAWDAGRRIGDVELVPVPSRVANGVYLRKDIGEKFIHMRADAEKQGILLDPTSGFRSNTKQVALWTAAAAAGAARLAAGFSVQYNGAAPKPHNLVPLDPLTAYPGTSNHQDATAVDIWLHTKIAEVVRGSLHNGRKLDSFSDKTRAAVLWLRANAWRYGFKENPKEPWHWSPTGR